MTPTPAAERRSIRTITSARALAVGVAAFLLLGVTACGSDEASEDAFCDAGASLQTNVAGLADLDVISEGTDGLKERFSTIEADVDELAETGRDVASEEISALESALDELGTALGALGDDISVDGAQAVGAALTGVVTASTSVFDKLSSTCD